MFSVPQWLRGRRTQKARARKPHQTTLHLESLEDRSVPATISAASNNAMFLIRANQSIWEYSSTYGWLQLTSPGFAVSISAVHETATGNDVVYALATNGWVYQYHLGAPWTPLGAYFKSISAGLDAGGYAEVFALTNNNGLFEFNRTVGVTLLGTNVQSMNAAGAETIYAVLTDGSVSVHTAGGWTSLAPSGSATQVQAVVGSGGSATVFILNGQGFIYESSGNGWNPVTGQAAVMSVGTDNSGNPVLYAIGGINGGLSMPALYEYTSTNSSASPLGYFQYSISGTSADTVFATLSDHSVWSFSGTGGWVELAGAGTALV